MEFSDESKLALDSFARRNGRLWKMRLKHCWMHGDYHKFGMSVDQAAALQRIRNHPKFRITMLRVYKPDLS